MSVSSRDIGRSIGRAALLLASCAAIGFAPAPAQAQSVAVQTLINQADYWRQRGRNDLAEAALRRARQIAPDSDEVRQAQARLAPPQQARPAPTPAPAPAPATSGNAGLARSSPTPAPARAAAPVDRAGRARVSGFNALESSNLATAAAQFQTALNANRRDGEALGGLGLVRLRQNRFAEAADLLDQASRYGSASQWEEALASARYFAGLERARTLLAQGNVAQAQADVEQLVRTKPATPAPALELLADIYDRQGRYADAADFYRQAAEGGEADETRLMLRASRSRALAAVERGDDLAAESEFQNGMMTDPEDPWIRYEFAQYMIKRGRVAETESLLRSLTRSQQPDALYAGALLSRDLGQLDNAEQLIQRIPEPQRTQSMRALAVELRTDRAIEQARALARSGAEAESLAALRQLAATPALPVSKQAAVASAMLDLGDTASAASLAERALGTGVTNIGDYTGLVSVFSRTGRDDLAGLAIQRARQLAGNSADGQDELARMNASLAVSQADRARLAGRFAESFDLLQSAWNAAPQDLEVLRALSRLYQSGNMPARAAQTFQMVLARDPQDRDALLGLTAAAQAAGDGALSEQAQRAVLKAYPADYQVLMALAEVEQARGNRRAAVRMLKEAREIYARQHGRGAIGGGNPFGQGGVAMGANPFRDMPTAQPVNPFALEDTTRPARMGAAAPTFASQTYPAPSYPAQSYSGPSYSGPTGSASSSSGPAYAGSSYANSSSGGSSYGGSPPVPARSPAMNSPAGLASARAVSADLPQPVFGGGAMGGSAGTGGYTAVPYGGDPVLAQLDTQIDGLTQQSGPRAELDTSYRQRSGEAGLSALDELKGSAKFSASLANGRVYARAEATVIDSGRPEGSGLARFGRNATIEAQAIADEEEAQLQQAETQHEAGITLAAGYESDLLDLEVGTTPVGMGETQAIFRAEVSPRLSENTLVRAWVERRPVTDSVVSYAGARDPVTGELWGQVLATGGGAAFSWDRDGNGIYGDVRYNRFEGTNVLDNKGVEANVGGYLRAYTDESSSLTAGLNLNYQTYDNNQNYFTFGHGGYFSPQSFLSVGFPLRYVMSTSQLDVNASLTPGFQSYEQHEVPLYPTLPAEQATLDDLKLLNGDVRSTFDSLSNTGFAVSADASVFYRVGPATRIGGVTSYNTFGNYSEFRSMFGVRQNFGNGR